MRITATSHSDVQIVDDDGKPIPGVVAARITATTSGITAVLTFQDVQLDIASEGDFYRIPFDKLEASAANQGYDLVPKEASLSTKKELGHEDPSN